MDDDDRKNKKYPQLYRKLKFIGHNLFLRE